MQIQMLRSRRRAKVGDILDVTPGVGDILIRRGFAQLHDPLPLPERQYPSIKRKVKKRQSKPSEAENG